MYTDFLNRYLSAVGRSLSHSVSIFLNHEEREGHEDLDFYHPSYALRSYGGQADDREVYEGRMFGWLTPNVDSTSLEWINVGY